MSGAPYIGQIVYLDKGKRFAQKVVRVHSTTVWTVPVGTTISSTHKGNLYDENSESPWRE